MTENQFCGSYGDIELKSFFTIFLYPFFFPQEHYHDVVSAVIENPQWLLDFSICDSSVEAKKHSRYLLPYAQRFLFPEVSFYHEAVKIFPPEKIHTKMIGYHHQPAHRLLSRAFGKSKQLEMLKNWTLIRCRHDLDKMPAEIPKEFTLKGKDEIRGLWKKVSMLTFPTGVGFLILDVEPAINEYTVESVKRFADSFSRLEDLAPDRPKAVLSGIPLDEIIQKYLLGCVMPFLERGSYNLGQAFLSRYWFFSVDTPEESVEAVLRDGFISGQPMAGEGVFHIGKTCASFTRTGAVVLDKASYNPSPEQIRFSWRTFYLDFFLQALFQRLSLLRFSWELSEIEELVHNEDKVERLHRRLLDFNNRSWFSQLTNADYGHRIYMRWQSVLETEKLYTEVKTQIRELDEYLERMRQRKISKIVNTVTLVAVPLGLVFSLFSTSFIGVNSGIKRDLGTAVLIAACFYLMMVLPILIFVIKPHYHIRRLFKGAGKDLKIKWEQGVYSHKDNNKFSG